MSWDFSLRHPETHETLHSNAKHSIAGGTMAVGGTTELWLNITYNYGDLFRKFLSEKDGIRVIEGMTAEDSIPLLIEAMAKMQGERDPDYWKATEGNAKAALNGLFELALLGAPNGGVWECS